MLNTHYTLQKYVLLSLVTQRHGYVLLKMLRNLHGPSAQCVQYDKIAF